MIESDIKSLKLQTHLHEILDDIGKPDKSIQTGIVTLDTKINGLYPSDLIVLAGRPSMGKTALATDIALHIGEKSNVLIFSLEMSAYSLIQRMLCNLASVQLVRLRGNLLTSHEDGDINKAASKLNKYNIFIDDTTNITPSSMVTTLEILNAKNYKIDCVIIDYVQLMSLPTAYENRNQEISAITRQLKSLCKKFNIPVILLSQLNRSVEHRENKRPLMSDLRDCGSIEQDADMIIFLYRPGYYSKINNPDAIDNGETELILAKVRNGPTGIVQCMWDANSMSFNPRLKFNMGEF